MTVRTNEVGVAVCRCGGELQIACSNGCADPDMVILETAPEKCQKHLEMQRGYAAKWRGKAGAP